MKKPLKCNQDWSEMTPTEGGRICGSCEKLIVDFRKKSWKEIEAKQAANNNALCGVYSEKQLKHWGGEVPKSNFCSKSLLYASMILSMNTAVNELHGKTSINPPKSAIIQTNKELSQPKNELNPSSDSLITITIKGKVIDEETGEGLIGATVLVKNTTSGTASNVEGDFILTYTYSNKAEHGFTGNIILVISYTGYKTQEIILNKTQANQRNLTLEPIMLSGSDNISVFYVTETTPWQRFKSRVKRIFRKRN